MNEPDPREGPGRIDELLRPFLTDSLLWPVVVVVVLSLSSFGAYLLARVFEGSLVAVAAVLGLGWMSQDAVRTSLRGGRPAPVAVLVLVLWAVSLVGGVVGWRIGLL